MSKKIYRTRRKHRSNKRSIKRTNRKIHKRTNKRINNRRKTNKRTNKHTHENENQNGGAAAFKSLFGKIGRLINEVELIWDDQNSSEIGFDNERGVLHYKKLGIREIILQPKFFSINNIYDSPDIGFYITLFDDEKDKRMDKITIKFTGKNAEEMKSWFMGVLYNYNLEIPEARGYTRPPSSRNTIGMNTGVSPQPIPSASAGSLAGLSSSSATGPLAAGPPSAGSLAGLSSSSATGPLAAGSPAAGSLATGLPVTTPSPLSEARAEVIARPQTQSLLPRANDGSRSSLTPRLKPESNVKWKMYPEGEDESNAVDFDNFVFVKLLNVLWDLRNISPQGWQNLGKSYKVNLNEMKIKVKGENKTYKLIRVDTNPKPSTQLTLGPGSGTPPSLILQQGPQNSPHPFNITPGTSASQSMESVDFHIVRFGNNINHCYRNAVYSVFLNNAFIRREIMKLKKTTDDADNHFIKCLKNIAQGETNNDGLHPGGPSKDGDDPLQINTAMYNYIDSYVKSTGSKEWVRFLNAGRGFSNEDQQDSGEFLGYFSRAFSLLGIKVCEYEQITATKMSDSDPQLFWNTTKGGWGALSGSTYQLTTFDDTLKQNELDLNEDEFKSIFTDYREIFIKDKKTFSIGDYGVGDDDTWTNRVINYRGPFNTTPNFVCLNNNRYKQNGLHFWKDMENYPILEEIRVPIFHINEKEISLNFQDYNYNCCGVIFHLGNTPTSGHYVSCVKINDVWYFFNDRHLPKKLETTEVRELFADTFQPPVKSVSRGDRFTIVTVIYELDRRSEP